MTGKQFEEAVWNIEGVRIVLRAPDTATVRKYKYLRADQEGHRITEWLNNRVVPRVGDISSVVIDGHGKIAHGASTLANVRKTYKNYKK